MPDNAIRAVAELAASQHRAFTRGQAADRNFDRGRIATAKQQGWLDEPSPGVLVIRGAPRTWHQCVMVATLSNRSGAVASHRSAARLHGLDGFERADVVEVMVERGRRRVTLDGVRCHQAAALEPIDLTVVDGIRCTSVARTLADLGSVVGNRARVRRALTDARRRDISLAWIHECAERMHRPGQRGTGILLRELAAIPFEGVVPDSWFEELLALCLVDSELPEVVPQYRIRDQTGKIVARTDLGVPAARLGLEAHSRRFHFGPDAERLDEQRDLRVASCGWELLYLGWYAARRPAEVLSVVKDVVAARLATRAA